MKISKVLKMIGFMDVFAIFVLTALYFMKIYRNIRLMPIFLCVLILVSTGEKYFKES